MCNRAAGGIMVCCSLTAPQCWRGQNGCVYCSWPPHSARQRSRFCGYLWSGGWAAQREDVYGTESGEFTSKWNWCISFPWLNFTTQSESTKLEKKKKKKGIILYFISSCFSGSVVVLLFTLCPAVIPSPSPLRKGTIWQCIKSISRAGFPLLKTAGTCPKITRFSHYFSVCRNPLCIMNESILDKTVKSRGRSFPAVSLTRLCGWASSVRSAQVLFPVGQTCTGLLGVGFGSFRLKKKKRTRTER